MNYKKYYEISLDLLNKEGLVIIDNVLWHGEVINKDINDKFKTKLLDCTLRDGGYYNNWDFSKNLIL